MIGPMFSQKTSSLISKYDRYEIGGKKCIMIKNKLDMRYNTEKDKDVLITHNGIKIKAKVCKKLEEIDEKIKEYDVICIDEIQFYEDAVKYCEKWANEGKIVEVCGLSGTSERTAFKIISELIPRVENIEHKKAICRNNGEEASFTRIKKEIKKEKEIEIGGNEKYEAVDRENYYK